MHPIHLCLVDDEVDLLRTFELFYEDEVADNFMQIKAFTLAESCLEYLKTPEGKKTELLLTDITMPKMDGYTLTQEALTLIPDLKVYICSAYNSPEYKNRAKDLGVSGFLCKPLNFEELLEKIENDFHKSA